MIINVYKPSGMTSHDVVDKVRKITGESKVGHGGTLDPFAEGVLVVGVTREGTKQLGKFSKNTEKEYIATIELGKTSETLDTEGPTKKEVGEKQIQKINSKEIIKTLKEFEGNIKQIPPKYSAVRIDGERAYKKARRGEDFELSPREVQIKEIDLLEWNPPELSIRVVSSSGTYIRSLARDIGEKLNVGGYLKKLIRTRVGKHTAKESKTLKELGNEF